MTKTRPQRVPPPDDWSACRDDVHCFVVHAGETLLPTTRCTCGLFTRDEASLIAELNVLHPVRVH